MDKVYNIQGHNVKVLKTEYCYNNSLAVQLNTTDGEPYAVITVCIYDIPSKNCAFVDTNNCNWAPKFLEENKLASPTGKVGYSGFCTYPEYKFNIELFNNAEE